MFKIEKNAPRTLLKFLKENFALRSRDDFSIEKSEVSDGGG